MEMFSFPNSWKNRFAPKQALFFWYRHYKVMFFVLFLIVLGFGGWSWYYSLYRYRWNDAEKKQFLDAYFKETAFKEAKFRDVIDRLKERAYLYEKNPDLGRDIFTGKEIAR